MFYRLGRFTFHRILVVSDKDYTKKAYPWWFFKSPRFYNRRDSIGFAWGILFSYSFEIDYQKQAPNLIKKKKKKK